MPLPTCEITNEPFADSGAKAPHVLPCQHVFSYTGLEQISRGQRDLVCPRCSAVISADRLRQLPVHKKISTFVRMLKRFRTNPSLMSYNGDAVLREEDGYPVFEGSLKTRTHASVPVHVKLVSLQDPNEAQKAWKDLTMLLQVTQAMGRSVVRAVGYIEQPRQSLAVIMEPSANSVMQLVKEDKLNAEFSMNLAQWTATALAALHGHHIMHAGFSPAALRYSSLHSRHHDSSDTPQGAQGSFVSRAIPGHGRAPSGSAGCEPGAVQQGDELRVMLSEFSCAAALVGPEFKTTNGRSCTSMGGMAEYFAAPERQQGTNVLHVQSDTWSYAMTMYYLLTGLDPNATRSLVMDRRHRHSNLLTGGETPDAREKSSGAPREFFHLLAKCMHADPEARPCMHDIAQRIQGIIDEGTFQNGKFVYSTNSQRRSSGRSHPGSQPPQQGGYPNHAVPDHRRQYGAQQLAADMQGAHINPDRYRGGPAGGAPGPATPPQRNGGARPYPTAQPQQHHHHPAAPAMPWQAPDARGPQAHHPDARKGCVPPGAPPEHFYGHQQPPPRRGPPPAAHSLGYGPPGSMYPSPQLPHHQPADNRYPPGYNYNQRRV